MRLSEAIRLGATMKPQAFTSGGPGSCALRAAADACGMAAIEENTLPYLQLEKQFPFLVRKVACPARSLSHQELRCHYMDAGLVIVYHLNDTHRWSREAIADFVELHEPTAMLPDLPPVEFSYEIQEVR